MFLHSASRVMAGPITADLTIPAFELYISIYNSKAYKSIKPYKHTNNTPNHTKPHEPPKL